MRGKFLDQVISLKHILEWGGAISVVLLPLSYNIGKWVQKTDDKMEFYQKQLELNEARTQLTVEFNEKVTKLERENSKLETLLEICQGKEVKYDK